MRLTLSQKEKLEELFKAVEILFNNSEFGLMYSEIEEAWLVGGVLRDLSLFKNPPIGNYDFYVQVNERKSIYPWLARLTEKQIPFQVTEEMLSFNKEQVYQVIILSLQDFGIDYEINIFAGNVAPKDFILENFPVSVSLIGLDISDLFISLGDKEPVEKIVKKIWHAPEYKKDVETKTITVLKQKWMNNQESYAALEHYLEKIYQKLHVLNFH